MYYKIKGRKKLPKVSRWEWDFSQCPPDELHDCYYYEFMREWNIVREQVAEWRKAHAGSKFDDWRPMFSKITRENRPRSFSYELFNFCPEWPSQPYLSIKQNERQRRRQMIFRPAPQSDKSRALGQVNVSMIIRDHIERGIKYEPTLDALERCVIKQNDGLHEIAAFEIDWRHSDGTIIKRFSSWLKSIRPKSVSQWTIKGQGTDSAQMMKNLNALGAWRLLKIFHWEDAAKETAKFYAGGKSLFGEQPNWIRARKYAESLLTSFPGGQFL